MLSVIDDKFNSLKIEISKESGNRFECIENLKSYLENDVPKLNEMLNNEKIKREEGDDNLDKKTTEEIMQIQDVIVNDKKNREQTNITIKTKDIGANIGERLFSERKQITDNNDLIMINISEKKKIKVDLGFNNIEFND